MAVRAERITIRLMSWFALVLLVVGGWVFIWNGDGGGPFPVALIVPEWAVIVYASAVGVLVSAYLVGRTRFARWFLVIGAAIATGSTLLVRRSVLSDAGGVNDSATPSGGPTDVDNALTRAVSGQLTDVDTSVFATTWLLSAVLLLFAGVLAARQLARRDELAVRRARIVA